MKTKFELVAKKNNIDLDKAKEYFAEVLNDGDGFVMIYRNKNNDEYYMLVSGFTPEQCSHSANLIAHGIVCEHGVFDPSGGQDLTWSDSKQTLNIVGG